MHPAPSLTLMATTYSFDQLLSLEAPQVALAGRSNVGKSSLINALAGRKQLAKTSSTPGKTRSINYYAINDGNTFLVDLPGYGYAKCSQDERNRWAKLLEKYFQSCPGLRGLALLIDSRLTPQLIDVQLAQYAISLGLRVLPVMTKADKCTRKELHQCRTAWAQIFGHNDILVTSAGKRQGVDALWQEVLALLVVEETEQGLEGEEGVTPENLAAENDSTV